MKIKRIMVPVDFSAASLAAVDYAVGFAKPLQAELAVLFVVEPIYYLVPPFAGSMGVDLLKEQCRSSRRMLARLQQRYAKRRVKLRALLQVGTAHQAIVDTARKLKTDLIIMATHGRTGVSHLLLGSVAEHVVRRASCAVLTVRPKARSRAGARKRAVGAGQRATKSSRRGARR